jgi:hypothetical protein
MRSVRRALQRQVCSTATQGASVPCVAGWASADPEVIQRDSHELHRIAAA